MRKFLQCTILSCLLVFTHGAAFPLFGQSIANSGMIRGTVTDPSGAIVPGATVTIQNPVSQYLRTTTTNSAGQFSFINLPFNPYHMTVTAKGFNAFVQDEDVRSSVTVVVPVKLQVGTSATTVHVTGEDLLENSPTFHTDVSRQLFAKLPLESQSSSLSSLVTLASPGIAADSNGLFHGLGDHASNSFSIDGQSITDQQSKVFSNQLPVSSIQSIEVIDGAPPAEYGDKTSVVIVATTRSGQGMTKPTGQIYSSYGSFGSSTGGFDVGDGKQNWGNFLSVDLLNTGRFLDPPEFAVFHDKGNEENLFDRIDYSLGPKNSLHLNLNYSRSWFQTPNSYDNLNVMNDAPGTGSTASPALENVGNTDQRSKIGTFDIYPSYTLVINDHSVLNLGAWVRKDLYNYFPSNNRLADLGPPNLQTSSIAQIRTLMNTAGRADYTWAKGMQNLDLGVQYGQTFLRESDTLGIVDNTYNSPCADANGNPLPGYSSPADCTSASVLPNPNYLPLLAPYDLTRGGSSYYYFGHTDVKELALWAEDRIHIHNWNFNLGLRQDNYNGLADAKQTEPRLGISYQLQKTNTVLGVSYARTLETPFNENLVLSSQGCDNAVLAPLLLCNPGATGTLAPGFRNEFHTNLQQAFGRHFVISGEYIWKYTHNAFDFSVLGNTPITFPIDWHNSKIPGFALRAEMPTWNGVSAFVVMSSVAARFFPPQTAGAGATSGVSIGTNYPFRIDHDERYNETTHLQYTIPGSGWFHGSWAGLNWRYDSGLVAGSVPCYNVIGANTGCGPTSITLPNGQPGVDLSGLTYDQQFEAGISCDGVRATPASGFTSCDNAGYKSNLVQIPAPNTENEDHNPPRVAPRNLFDASIGNDNLFHTDHYQWGVTITAINFTNKYALYNFLSTFSGTHYVTPRAITAQLDLHF